MDKDVFYLPMNYMVFVGAASTTFLVTHFLHAPYWVGAICGVLFIVFLGWLLMSYQYGVFALPPSGGVGTGLIVTYFLHAPVWIGLASGFAFAVLIVAAYFGLRAYMESKRVHDEYWDKIDLTDVIVPTLIFFVFVIVLGPVFIAARNKTRSQKEKAMRHQLSEKQSQEKANPSSSPLPVSSPKAAPNQTK